MKLPHLVAAAATGADGEGGEGGGGAGREAKLRERRKGGRKGGGGGRRREGGGGKGNKALGLRTRPSAGVRACGCGRPCGFRC